MPVFEHPDGYFRVKVPRGWKARFDEKSGELTFLPKSDARGKLVIAPIDLEAYEVPSSDGASKILKALTEVSGVKRKGKSHVGRIGESSLAWCDGSWTSERGVAEAGRLWVLAPDWESPFAVYASHSSPAKSVGAAQEQIEREHAIVRSIEVLRPPEPPDDLVDLAIAKLNVARPDWEVKRTAPLELTVNDGDLQISLENLVRSIAQNPRLADEAMDGWVRQVIETHEYAEEHDHGPPDLDAVRDALRPLLKPRTFLGDAPEGVSFVAGDFVLEDLVVVYVIDRENAMVPVQRSWLQAWELDRKTLAEIALANLARSGRQLDVQAAGPTREKIMFLTLSTGDGYDATRVIQPGIYELFSDLLGKSFLIGIPNRDFLIAFRDEEPDMVRHFRQQIAEQAVSMPWPLTPIVLRMSRVKGETRLDPAGEPPAPRAKKRRKSP